MAVSRNNYSPLEGVEMPLIGQFVHDVREARHLTQAELARRCGLSRAYINALESGNVKEPSGKTLSLLARALDLEILELLEATGTIETNGANRISNESQLSSYLRRERNLSEGSIQSILHLIRLYELGDKAGV
ncbi:MAG TPA: helix-turn-helix transcriptional regulator [Chloroflexota bacterium]|nr:helix-turn-helix transcriptional regulator [Chloroflexota bacterium]